MGPKGREVDNVGVNVDADEHDAEGVDGEDEGERRRGEEPRRGRGGRERYRGLESAVVAGRRLKR